jgi:hypothetical protein
MEGPDQPKLQFLHSDDVLNPGKLDQFRRLSVVIVSSLAPGQPCCLKARLDGTVLDGHHRLFILMERDVDIHGLPREIIERES